MAMPRMIAEEAAPNGEWSDRRFHVSVPEIDMARNHFTLGVAAPDKRQGSPLQAGLGWVMVLLVMLVASVGFTLDHVLAIAP